MKKMLVVKAPIVAMLVSGFTSTMAEEEPEGPQIFPVETWTCKYNEGQGPAELDKVIEGWNSYMDDQQADNYFAMTMTPYYFGGETFDVAWLGAAPTAEELGVGADQWAANGGKHAAAFARVLSCDSHSNFATMLVKEPPDKGTPNDSPVLSFANCSAAEGKTMTDVFDAMDAWTAYTIEKGYRNGEWVMFPAYGVDDVDFDFKLVNGYDSHEDMGKDYDLYANGGGYQKHAELLGGVLRCDVGRVYDGTVHRRIADGD